MPRADDKDLGKPRPAIAPSGAPLAEPSGLRVELDLDGTTVLIGENNSGKSSLIDAIRLCLDRALYRRGGSGFDDYDHHLAGGDSPLSDAPTRSVTLDFAERKVGEWAPELIQTLSDAVTADGANLRHVVLRVTSRFETHLGDFSSDYQFLNAAGQALGPKTRNPRLLADA